MSESHNAQRIAEMINRNGPMTEGVFANRLRKSVRRLDITRATKFAVSAGMIEEVWPPKSQRGPKAPKYVIGKNFKKMNLDENNFTGIIKGGAIGMKGLEENIEAPFAEMEIGDLWVAPKGVRIASIENSMNKAMDSDFGKQGMRFNSGIIDGRLNVWRIA